MPPLPQTTGLSWRPLTTDDVEAWYALVAEIQDHDELQERTTVADLRRASTQPWVDLATDTLVGVDADGVFRAWGRVIHRPGAARQIQVILVGGVQPAWRGRGIGRALLGWQRDRGVEKVRELTERDPAAADLPARLTVPAEDQVVTRARLAAAAGFAPIRYFSTMRRRLLPDADDPAYCWPPLPDGVAVEPFTADLSEPVRRAHNEAFGEHWGSTALDKERWRGLVLEEEAFRPGLSFVALDHSSGGPEVAGYVVNAEFIEDWRMQGFSEGYTDMLGVRRPWRGRGIARALLQASATAFLGAGHRSAALDVDTENATGALAVYIGLGYEAVHRTTVYGLSLDR